MEQPIHYTIDSSLLERVSRIRKHMGLEALPEISMHDIDPMLLYYLREQTEEDAPTVLEHMLLEQQGQWPSSEFWKDWTQWSEWTQWSLNI